MSLKRFLLSFTFFKHLAIAIIVIAALVFITLQSLKIYTHHGQSYPVPSFAGLSVAEAMDVALENRMRVQVIDSVYTGKVKPGAVVDQVPAANARVKQNRTIFLTINSTQPEKVTLPKLTDISFRQAQVLIENCGLVIDSISYEPSEYNDLVLMVRQESEEVFEGDRLVKGSSLHLTVGRSSGNLETPLPNVLGLLTEEAKTVLTNAKLNQGVIIYDSSIETREDSLNARVWKQQPDAKFVEKVYLGSSVDMWITVDTAKINRALKTNF